MAIAINLKTKAMKDSKKRDKKKVATGSGAEVKSQAQIQQESLVHKQHAENIEKWTERGRELRDEVQGAAKTLVTKDAATADAASAGTSEKIAKTAKGEPMCLLCKRKFPNVEKLRQHEQLSALHKDNLAKKAAADAAASEQQQKETNQQYRDRAKERRVMCGPEASSVATLLRSGANEAESTVVTPEDNLGDSNIGNQMLQKLGWKAGSSLGRNTSSEGGQEQPQQRSMEASLKEDWKRIESLASGKRN
jgi:RNA-binding protein 5/10